MLWASPHADIGSYLFIQGDIAAFTFNYVGGVFLVQGNGYTGPNVQTIDLVQLLVALTVDIGNPGGLSDLKLDQGYDRTLCRP